MSTTSVQLRVREATTVRVIPYALIAASFLLSMVANDDVVPPGRLPAIIALSVGAVSLRIVLERIYDRARAVQLTWFLAHGAVAAVLVLLSPLYGCYVFAGYLDAFALLTGERSTPPALSVRCRLWPRSVELTVRVHHRRSGWCSLSSTAP